MLFDGQVYTSPSITSHCTFQSYEGHFYELALNLKFCKSMNNFAFFDMVLLGFAEAPVIIKCKFW